MNFIPPKLEYHTELMQKLGLDTKAYTRFLDNNGLIIRLIVQASDSAVDEQQLEGVWQAASRVQQAYHFGRDPETRQTHCFADKFRELERVMHGSVCGHVLLMEKALKMCKEMDSPSGFLPTFSNSNAAVHILESADLVGFADTPVVNVRSACAHSVLFRGSEDVSSLQLALEMLQDWEDIFCRRVDAVFCAPWDNGISLCSGMENETEGMMPFKMRFMDMVRQTVCVPMDPIASALHERLMWETDNLPAPCDR